MLIYTTEMILEKSLFMIKPEGMKYKDTIRDRIERSGLEITQSKTQVFDNVMLNTLYGDAPKHVRRAQAELFNEKYVEVGIVLGAHAVSSLFDLIGHFADPRMCNGESLRYLYGEHNPIVINDVELFKNAIHRPKNVAEAALHISVLE